MQLQTLNPKLFKISISLYFETPTKYFEDLELEIIRKWKWTSAAALMLNCKKNSSSFQELRILLIWE